jgi:hypothetical protein
MAGSNFNDPGNNDLARGSGRSVPSGPEKDSEVQSNRPETGVAGAGGTEQATPEAKRAGYGYSFQPEGSAAMGGHNIDARNQYTVKMPRGSSL